MLNKAEVLALCHAEHGDPVAALGLHADTIKALDEPHDGEQRFAAYACGGAQSREQPLRQSKDVVQTYPVKEH